MTPRRVPSRVSRHNLDMATGTSLSHVFPLGSRLNERGHIEVGGCDTIELAREFGTPAYVVAEDDLRARARAFVQAGRDAGQQDFHVVFASKAFPCTAVLGLFAEEGLWCDVASGGELHLALNAGFAPERILMHGNAKSEAELRMALEHRIGLIVIDNFDEIDRLAGLLAERRVDADPVRSAGRPAGRSALKDDSFRPVHVPVGRTVHAPSGTGPHAALSSSERGDIREGTDDHRQSVLIRATPNVRGDTHEKISTGQADSKFGFSMADIPAAIERVRGVDGLVLEGVHAHIGSQILELEPFRREAAALAELGSGVGGFSIYDLGGGLGVAYTEAQHPPEIEEWVGAVVGAAHEAGISSSARLLVEPGRALTANAGVTLYTVESVKRNVSTWVAVDGGMSDNLRPMLYGAVYEAHIADRFGDQVGAVGDLVGAANPVGAAEGAGAARCVLAGKHCESGDVIVREALFEDPKPGDVIVTPATGAYGFAMASNYNGVPRPPVLFCKDGDARVVVRRESFEDLTARDVD
jgi:diaminopimelate decarboxylase